MKNVWILFAVGMALFLSTSAVTAQDWNQQSSGCLDGFNGISFADEMIGWAAGWDSQNIYHTIDGGQTWTTQAPSDLVYFFDINFCDAQNGVACGSDGGILYTNDGTTWNTAMYGWWLTHTACHQRTPDHGMVVGSNSIFQPMVTWTTDGWQTYNQAIFYFMEGSVGVEGNLTDIHLVDENICFATGSAWNGKGAICSSTDGGTTWTTDLWSDSVLYSITFPTAQVGYAVGGNGFILKTVNGGASWSMLSSGVTATLQAVDFDSAGVGLVVGDAGLVLSTTDGGTTWITENSSTMDTLYGVDCLGETTGFAAGDAGTIIAKAGDPATLIADASTVSGGTGGMVNFTIQAGTDHDGKDYAILGSLSGTTPGLPLPGGLATLPINHDFFTDVVVANINGPIFKDFAGTLDASGAASAQLDTMGPIDPRAIGVVMSFACFTYNTVDFASNAVNVTIVK